MRIQILSDIHLDYRKSLPNIRPKAPYLFLAGDIGNIETSPRIYKEFMDYVSKYWTHTFVILGNHELYSNAKNIEDLTDVYVALFQKYNNITFLNNEETYIEGYRVLGSTLWSHIDISKKDSIMKYVNSIDKMNITPMIYNKLHYLSAKWLETNYISSYPKTIIITHYPATQNIDTYAPKHRYQSQHIKDVIGTNIAGNKIFPYKDNKIIFISGHTHYSFDITDPLNKNIRYISNQLGYPNERTQFYPNSNNRTPLDILENVFDV
jgi:hypothetical protein